MISGTVLRQVSGVAILLAASAGAAVADTYVNARYGYSVAYPPDLLIAEPESDSGDGRTFHARHGTATMSVWANAAAATESPDQITQGYVTDCGPAKPGYRVVKPGLVAFSCITPKNRVLYFKAVIHGDWMTAVRFEYPIAERKVWDPVVQRVAKSLIGTSDTTTPR